MYSRCAQVSFIAVCIGLAWYTWTSLSEALPQYKGEGFIIPTIVLYGLTLPASLLVQVVYAGLVCVTQLDRLDVGTTFLHWLLKTWGPLTIAGYVQWFVFVPCIVRRWRAHRRNRVRSGNATTRSPPSPPHDGI